MSSKWSPCNNFFFNACINLSWVLLREITEDLLFFHLKNCFICSKWVRAQLSSCVWLFVTPWTVDHQVFLSMEFSRQEYWSGLPFPTPGDLPDPGIKPTSPVSPALASGYFTTAPPGNPIPSGYHFLINIVITNVYKHFCKWITEKLPCSFLEITLLKVSCMYNSYEHLYYVCF